MLPRFSKCLRLSQSETATVQVGISKCKTLGKGMYYRLSLQPQILYENRWSAILSGKCVEQGASNFGVGALVVPSIRHRPRSKNHIHMLIAEKL